MAKSSKDQLESAIQAVNQKGILLVFAIKERPQIPSLWSHFYPRSIMRWEWDSDGDDRVAKLWFLREKLSSSHRIVYAKWFRGRATLISKPLLPALLRILNPNIHERAHLPSAISKDILHHLEESSPLSTKQLKDLSGLKGREFEADYTAALKELWQRLLIVGCGEIDDGAFPSLAMASTKLYFEEEWAKASQLSLESAWTEARKRLGDKNIFYEFLQKLNQRMKNAKAPVPQIKKRAFLRHSDL